MATKVVEKSKVDISKTPKTKKSITPDKKTSKASTLIVATLILFIFSYIAVDYFVVNRKIDNKIIIVNQKFDTIKIQNQIKLNKSELENDLLKLQIQLEQTKNKILKYEKR